MKEIVKEYIIELGLEVVKDKLLEEEHRIAARERLKTFIEKQTKINYHCTIDEELDFEEISKYIMGDLFEDVKIRLFGNDKERHIARQTIVDKAVDYSQAKTKLSRKRAVELVTAAMDILRNFYKSKVNKDLLFITGQIADTVIEQEQKMEQYVGEVGNRVIREVKRTVEGNAPLSIEKGVKLLKQGEFEQVEEGIETFLNAIGTSHSLYPNYRYEMEYIGGKPHFISKPLSQEALSKYPPKIVCSGTMQINGKEVNPLKEDIFGYAYRHQFPITLNIMSAQKFLGDVIDPAQYEATNLIGKTIVVPPKPFPAALPSSIAIDDEVLFEYVLLRTQEILEDGICIISNSEQENTAFRITIRLNLRTKDTTYNINIQNPNNEERLQYARFFKKAFNGSNITIKVLSLNEPLAYGKLGKIDYHCDFKTIDEEVEFWENIVAIEKYLDREIDVPRDIYEKDIDTIDYWTTLLRGEEWSGTWENMQFSMKLTEEFRERILEMEDEVFNYCYIGSVNASLFNEIYEIPVSRTFMSIKYLDLKKLKQKVEILDIGDTVKVELISATDEGIISWQDKLYNESIVKEG